MPTKEEFEAYLEVQMSGKYNMVMNANEAAEAAGLSLDTYWSIIDHYSELSRKYAA